MIIFYFCHYCLKSKKLECPEKIEKKIKIKALKGIIIVDDKKKNQWIINFAK